MELLKPAGVAALALLAAPAAAHVTVQPATAPAGAYQVLRFGSGHGCDGKATTSIRIELPAAVTTARPQPKPGWRLAIDHPGGDAEVTRAITWTGKLPPDQYEEFLVLVKLPADAGSLAFPAIQSCGATQVRWEQPIVPGGPRPEHPAPTLTVTPTAAPPPAAGEHHHH